MNKFTKILMEVFMNTMASADYDWNLLSDTEQEIFGDEETFNVVLKECRIQLYK